VDLQFGRLEGGGLRCLYHGGLYASDGRCLEQPAEPARSRFASKIRITSYAALKRVEFERYLARVTDWEQREYFTLL
jgi:phthalate 4,5-dioxygenase